MAHEKAPPGRGFGRVRLRGLEPPRGCPHMDLNHACIPISPQPQGATSVASRSSGFPADVLDESGHVLATVEADRSLIAARPESESAARPLEEIEDVARV